MYVCLFACLPAFRSLFVCLSIVFTNCPGYHRLLFACCGQLIALTNSSSSNGHRLTWSSAALLSRSHCGLQGGINPRIYTEAIVTFQIYTGNALFEITH